MLWADIPPIDVNSSRRRLGRCCTTISVTVGRQLATRSLSGAEKESEVMLRALTGPMTLSHASKRGTEWSGVAVLGLGLRR